MNPKLSLSQTKFWNGSLSQSGQKTLILILFLMLQFSNTFSTTTVQKGGILFEGIGGAQVNGEYMVYKRVAETAKLEEGVQAGADLVVTYINVCNRVLDSVKKAKEKPVEKTDKKIQIDNIVSPIKFQIKEANRICKNMNARLPEIKTWDDHARILTLMQKLDIHSIKAGIMYQQDIKLFSYISDNSPAHIQSIFPKISYGGDWPGGEHEADYQNSWLDGQAARYFLIYQRPRNNENTVRLRLVDNIEREYIDYIICERVHVPEISKFDIESNMLYQVIAHNCARDMRAVVQHMNYAVTEATLVTNLNITVQHRKPDYKAFFPDMSEIEKTFSLLNPQRRTRSVNDSGELQQGPDNSTMKSGELQQGPDNSTMHSGELQQGPDNSTAPSGELQQGPDQQKNRATRSIQALSVMGPSILTIPANAAVQQLQQEYENEIQQPIAELLTTPRYSEYKVDTYSYEVVMTNNFQTSHRRSKRALPLIPLIIGAVAGTAGANLISSAVTGDAPLSWFGKSIGPLLGLSTNSDPNVKEVLLAIAKEMSELKLNDEKIINTITQVVEQTLKFERKYLMNMDAVVMLVMTQDLSHTIKYIAQIIQGTVNKFAQILLASAVGKTSPYALNVDEITMLSHELYRTRGINLETNINLIRSKAINENNKLVLIFEIPILSESKQYHFYSPTPIPIFQDSEVHLPILDANYIAISKSGSKYYTMTPEEFRQCKTTPSECHIHRPARPLNDMSSCTIRSYTMNKLQCPVAIVSPTTITPPFFHIDGNKVFYAVNGSLTMYIKCQQHKYSSAYKDETLTVTDQGEVTLRSSCTVTLPDGSTFETSSITEVKDLAELPLYDQLVNLTKSTGYKLTKQNETIVHFNTTILVEQKPAEETDLTLQQLIENTFHPKTQFAFATMISIVIFIIVIIAGTCCCCRHNIMACLRSTNLRKPNPNKPTRLIDRYQKEMHERMDKIGKDVNSFKSDLIKKFTTKSGETRQAHDAHVHMNAELSESLQNVQFQKNPDYEEFNPSTLNRTKFRNFHTQQRQSHFPSELQQQLAEADLAYRRDTPVFL